MYKALIEAGFTAQEAEEIIARVACGESIDSAMQAVM